MVLEKIKPVKQVPSIFPKPERLGTFANGPKELGIDRIFSCDTLLTMGRRFGRIERLQVMDMDTPITLPSFVR